MSCAPARVAACNVKRAFGDGTVAVDMDPPSLVARLAAAAEVSQGEVRGGARVGAQGRPRIASRKAADQPDAPPEPGRDEEPKRRGARRLWAELLARTFAIDVLQCPRCSGRMKLVAMVTCPLHWLGVEGNDGRSDGWRRGRLDGLRGWHHGRRKRGQGVSFATLATATVAW